MTSQTSDRVSSIASRYANFNAALLEGMTPAELNAFGADVRSMAASLLRQDEHRGLRGLFRKVVGA